MLLAALATVSGGSARAGCGAMPDDATLLATPRAEAAIAAGAKMVNADGRLYRIETDPPSYLIGTFHTAAGGIDEPGPLLTRIVAGARRLYVEVVEAELAAALKRWAADPERRVRSDGRLLSDGMSLEEIAVAESALAEYGMPLVVADNMAPIALMSLLARPPCAQDTVERPGLDVRLERVARGAGVPVKGLESAEEQFAVVDGELADALLKVGLLTDPGDVERWFVGLALYRTRHIAAIWAESFAGVDDILGARAAAELDAAAWASVIATRNRRMRDRLLPALAEGGVVVAVGALHLPGEDGLVQLLREAGFNVRPMSE
ncbi:TraB/GumN family protein [Acuticoccus mangrovi]|uniref:TraB/GumN family protein n=1 Tax=Acuticoccus mangrovi TaxID=2796142 RepID=A0A934MFS8_9HYPH|nr:TraB/GumN family protein [Acuticoccus mangrovi]MBJ3775255.1 TraB/GumN family protein [Acuticoccus mangrovi]